MNDFNNLNQQALDQQAFQAQQQALNQQAGQVQQGFVGQQTPNTAQNAQFSQVGQNQQAAAGAQFGQAQQVQQNAQIPQNPQIQAVGKTKPVKQKKKGHLTAAVAGSIAAVILVAGGAGFGGAFIANKMNAPAIVSESENSSTSSATSDTPTLNEMQQNVSSVNSENRNQNGVEFNSDGSFAYTRDLVAAVQDSVVYISNYVDNGYQKGYSLGSGIIISTDGYIITNNHIISDGIKDCEVSVNKTASDGTVTATKYKAELIGTDERTDLAVLKIDAQNLQAAKLGDSDKMKLGDDIVIIGNPVLTNGMTLTTSVSKGVVSGLNREISATGKGLTSIQTDAPINGGNSGGAMFNAYGEVVGIVDFKIVTTNAENLGFGITINEAKQVVEDLISRGYVSGRPMLGIVYQNITQSAAYYSGMTPGLYVTEVKSDYPVANSGLIAGDTIVEIDGKSVLTNDISTILANKHPGDKITLVVVRNDGIRQRQVSIDVELGEYKGN